MPPEEQLFTADILGSEADTGEIRCKLGDAATEEGYSDGNAIYGPDGFIGRPNPPDADGKSCQALYVQDGDDHKIIGTRDNRYKDKVGTLDPGDRAIVTDAEARIFVRKERSAVVAYTLNVPANKSMVFDLGGVEGVATLVNGGAVFTMRDDEIVLGINGGGSIKINGGDITISGSTIQLVAPIVQLGDAGGGTTPPPLPPALGVAYGVPGPIVTVSTKVFVAP